MSCIYETDLPPCIIGERRVFNLSTRGTSHKRARIASNMCLKAGNWSLVEASDENYHEQSSPRGNFAQICNRLSCTRGSLMQYQVGRKRRLKQTRICANPNGVLSRTCSHNEMHMHILYIQLHIHREKFVVHLDANVFANPHDCTHLS